MRFLIYCVFSFVCVSDHAFANQNQDGTDTSAVLIRPGETQQVALDGVCRRIVNNGFVAISIDVAPPAKWPRVFEDAKRWPAFLEGYINVAECTK